MNTQNLGARLMSVASFVREGSAVADVGTDHAYLPIFLINSKRSPRAIASDVNPGPLERAAANISDADLSDKISCVLADGLNGIEKYAPDDVIIAGMGGELIAEIISKAPWVKEPSIRLILQPMTKEERLREALIGMGFSILEEDISAEGGKIYQTICAEYTSQKAEPLSPAELLLGKVNILRSHPLLPSLARHKANILKKRRDGLLQAGADASDECRLIDDLLKIAESKN